MISDDVIARSHEIDDLEIMRTAAVRSLRRNIALLELALHALRAGRTGVTDEFLDRAINDMYSALAKATALA